MNYWVKRYLINVAFFLFLFVVDALTTKVRHYTSFILYGVLFALAGGVVLLLLDKSFRRYLKDRRTDPKK